VSEMKVEIVDVRYDTMFSRGSSKRNYRLLVIDFMVGNDMYMLERVKFKVKTKDGEEMACLFRLYKLVKKYGERTKKYEEIAYGCTTNLENAEIIDERVTEEEKKKLKENFHSFDFYLSPNLYICKFEMYMKAKHQFGLWSEKLKQDIQTILHLISKPPEPEKPVEQVKLTITLNENLKINDVNVEKLISHTSLK